MLLIFFFVQQGDKNLENVTHEEAVATLKATQDRVVLLVAKPDGILQPPPPASDQSLSPQPRKDHRKARFSHLHVLYVSPAVEDLSVRVSQKVNLAATAGKYFTGLKRPYKRLPAAFAFRLPLVA